ncbi:putative Brefeldin A-inhibited guanine nucleotide-exchange protein 1 [Blattamonas nauphoetae]|uniref:Brefeldin A-inhibited guanine nucleotide-exchange protein 1 n=1 Tax=Blattamonas nauphoetae TaxID=2049346 RepID=A0ABQ9XMD7_9EUKA|nr:putative Brefeldin A-inhibited guanine nucleotide-exchange protein 1 [Blattamonas nauphoetae]
MNAQDIAKAFKGVQDSLPLLRHKELKQSFESVHVFAHYQTQFLKKGHNNGEEQSKALKVLMKLFKAPFLRFIPKENELISIPEQKNDITPSQSPLIIRSTVADTQSEDIEQQIQSHQEESSNATAEDEQTTVPMTPTLNPMSPSPQPSPVDLSEPPSILDDLSRIISYLCRLGIKETTEHKQYYTNVNNPMITSELTAACETIKLLCLSCTHALLSSQTDIFKTQKMMMTVKREVIELILHNLGIIDLQVFRFSVAITSQVILLYELKFKDEISHILRVLMSIADLGADKQEGNTGITGISQIPEKVSIVELLIPAFKSETFLVNLFFSFDCDITQGCVFEGLVTAICDLAGFRGRKAGERISTGEGEYTIQKLELVSLKALATIVNTISKWSSEHAVPKQVPGRKDSRAFKEKPADQPSSGTAKTFDETRQQRHKMDRGIELFNKSFKKGIEYLTKEGMMENTPENIAKFIFDNETLSRSQIGEFFGQAGEFYIETTRCYLKLFNMEGITIDQALSKFLSTFRISGESQKIYRIMECFGDEYFEQNPDSFPSAECAFMIAYQCLILHSVAHTGMLAQLPKHVFVEQGQGQGVSDDYLREAYDRVISNEIKVFNDDDERTKAALADQKAKVKNKRQLERQMKEQTDEQRRLHAKLMWQKVSDLQRTQESGGVVLRSVALVNGNLAQVLHSSTLGEQTRGMFGVIGEPILKAVIAVLKSTKNDEAVKLCMDIARTFIDMACVFDLSDHIGMYVESLCLVVSGWGYDLWEKKHFEVCRLLLSLGHTRNLEDGTSGNGNMMRSNFILILGLSGVLNELLTIGERWKGKDEELKQLVARTKGATKEDRKDKETPNSNEEILAELFSGFSFPLSLQKQVAIITNATELVSSKVIGFQDVDSIFAASSDLTASAFVDFVEGLSIAAERVVGFLAEGVEAEAEIGSSQNGASTLSGVSCCFNVTLFFISKLIYICTSNNETRGVGVWDRVWPILSSHLLRIMVSIVCIQKSEDARKSQLEQIEAMIVATFRNVVLSMFARSDIRCPPPIPFFSAQSQSTSTSDPLSQSTALSEQLPWHELKGGADQRHRMGSSSRQEIFLRPFESLSSSGVTGNVRHLILDCVTLLAETYSPRLLSGWNTVFGVLKSTAGSLDTMNAGFGLIVWIIGHKMHCWLPFGMASAVSAVVAFIRNKFDGNVTRHGLLLLEYMFKVVSGKEDLGQGSLQRIEEDREAAAVSVGVQEKDRNMEISTDTEKALLKCLHQHLGVYDFDHLAEFVYPILLGLFDAASDIRREVQKASYELLFRLLAEMHEDVPGSFFRFIWRGVGRPILEDMRMQLMEMQFELGEEEKRKTQEEEGLLNQRQDAEKANSLQTGSLTQKGTRGSPMSVESTKLLDGSGKSAQKRGLGSGWVETIFVPVMSALIGFVGKHYIDLINAEGESPNRLGKSHNESEMEEKAEAVQPQSEPVHHPLLDLATLLSSFVILGDIKGEVGVALLGQLLIQTSRYLGKAEWDGILAILEQITNNIIPIQFDTNGMVATTSHSTPILPQQAKDRKKETSPQDDTKGTLYVSLNRQTVARRCVLQTEMMGMLEKMVLHLISDSPPKSDHVVNSGPRLETLKQLIWCMRKVVWYTRGLDRDMPVRTHIAISGIKQPHDPYSLKSLEGTATAILINTLFRISEGGESIPAEFAQRAKAMLMYEMFDILSFHAVLISIRTRLAEPALFGQCLHRAFVSADLAGWRKRIDKWQSEATAEIGSHEIATLVYLCLVSSLNVEKEMKTILPAVGHESEQDIKETTAASIVQRHVGFLDKLSQKHAQQSSTAAPLITQNDISNDTINFELISCLDGLKQTQTVACCLHTLHRMKREELIDLSSLLVPIVTTLTDSGSVECRRLSASLLQRLTVREKDAGNLSSNPFFGPAVMVLGGPYEINKSSIYGS